MADFDNTHTAHVTHVTHTEEIPKFVEVTATETPDEIATPVGFVTKTTTTSTTTEVREITLMEKYTSIFKTNPLYQDTSKVLHWRDPVKTGLLFGIFNFFFFLYTLADYSMVTIVSYLLLTLLTICFGYSNYVVLKASWLQGKRVENPFQERFKDVKFHVSRETATKYMDTALDLINTTIDLFRDVFYCTDNLLSARFAFYFYMGATIGNWFSGATLLYLVTLGFFLWPRLYEEKRAEIDHFYGIAKTQATAYVHLALTKLPPAVTARFPALKPKHQ